MSFVKTDWIRATSFATGCVAAKLRPAWTFGYLGSQNLFSDVFFFFFWHAVWKLKIPPLRAGNIPNMTQADERQINQLDERQINQLDER